MFVISTSTKWFLKKRFAMKVAINFKLHNTSKKLLLFHNQHGKIIPAKIYLEMLILKVHFPLLLRQHCLCTAKNRQTSKKLEMNK